MAKRNGSGNASLGRKVKMSQPVAIPWDLAIDLVDARVVKGPVVPKMEPMEKWIVSGGRSFSVSHDEGLTIVAITAPGIDGETRVEGIGETLPLATAKAIQALWRATPKPDPDGKDLPLFRAGTGLPDDDGDGHDDNPHFPFEFEPREPEASADGEPEPATDVVQETAGDEADDGTDRYGPPHGRANPDDQAAFVEWAQANDPEPGSGGFADDGPEWTFLFVADPQDLKRWKKSAPSVDGVAIVDFDDGSGESDRGWYLHPDYTYDPQVGFISKRDPVSGEPAMVWSRDAAREPVTAGASS